MFWFVQFTLFFYFSKKRFFLLTVYLTNLYLNSQWAKIKDCELKDMEHKK